MLGSKVLAGRAEQTIEYTRKSKYETLLDGLPKPQSVVKATNEGEKWQKTKDIATKAEA